MVTKGPQDAQEWTLDRKGLKGNIDFLVTGNDFGVSKVDGLFKRVMKELGI
jgi:putative hydrolase of the HAD superfamily